MDTALYYLASTIAQVLASAIALLGAIVLFRMQGLDASIRDAGKAAHHEGHNQWTSNPLDRAHEIGDFEGMSMILKSAGEKLQPLVEAEGVLNDRIDERRKLVRSLREAISATATGLMVSVGMIPFIPKIFESKVAIGLAVFALLILFAICLWTYTGVLKKVLEK